MIFQRKNDTVKLIEKLLKEISNKFPQNIKVIFDEKSENSFLKKDCNKEKYFISIGMKIDYKKNFNSLFVTKVIDIFHEYRHFIQYTKSNNIEIKTSIDIGNVCPSIKKMKYTMLPQELDAELYGILEAKSFFEERYPNIDFEKHLLEYVNNIERWYGQNPLKQDRPIFTTFEEIVSYLYENLEISYDYPIPIEYDGFDNKAESIRVANLSSGAEQFYLIANALYKEKLVDKCTLNATKTLSDFYNKNDELTVNNITMQNDKIYNTCNNRKITNISQQNNIEIEKEKS